MNYLKQLLLIFTMGTAILFSSCEKQEEVQDPITSNSKDSELERLELYLSRTLGLPKETIEYDNSKQIFYSNKIDFEIDFSEVQKRYNEANVYKSKFETN